MSVRRFPITAALLISGLSACVDAGATASNDSTGGGPFGAGFEDLDAGTAPPDSDAAVAEDGDSSNRVQLRVVQGVLNSRASYLCHAPDFDLENADAGLEGAVELPIALVDAGLEVTGYANVHSMTSGAITVHRLPILDAGYADAAAGTDAGLADGGSAAAADAGAATPVAPRCDQASLEAVLPLPMPAAWVDPPRADMDAGVVADAGAPPPEAGPSIEARGFVSTASGGATLTLFGSGLLIERAALESRVEEEKKRYERQHAGDAPGALAAADRYRRVLEAAYGPRFLLSRPQPALRAPSFSLHFAHLIADVPPAPDAESGALHLCITRDTMEGAELGDAGVDVFEFRNYAVLGDDLDPRPSYRFRVFVQSAFAQEQKTCATTSLRVVAEKVVDPDWFQPGRSYSLIAWGAVEPEKICTSTPGSLSRPGCGQGVDNLRARLELIEN